MSQTNLKLIKNDVRKFLVFKQSVQFSTKNVQASKGMRVLNNIPMNGNYRHVGTSLLRVTRTPSTYTTRIQGIVVGRGKNLVEIPLTRFMKPELPNMHKILSPFYVLLAIFGYVLVANLGIISTAIGFYKFIANLGLVLTIVSATVYLLYTYRNL